MENKILARINGREITERDMQLAISKFPRERQGYLTTDEGKRQLLEQLISFELYYNYSKEIGLEESQEFNEKLEILKREILTQMAIEKVISEVNVTDEEIKDYYESNKKAFTIGESITAKHILVDNEELAKEIKDKVENGMTFESAAEEYSSCPSKAQGGSLGKFGKGQMVPEFEKAAFELEIGVVSEPVKTQFGYHLIKVENKEEAKAKSLNEVEGTIKSGLSQEKQNYKYMSFTDDLKKKYLVEIL